MSECSYVMVPNEAARTLMRLAGVGGARLSPDQVAEAKAAVAQAIQCTEPTGHGPEHRNGDRVWLAPSPDDEEDR